MKSLQEFITESEKITENESEDVFVVYFGDGTMENFYYTEEEAKSKVEELNKENSDAQASFKKEAKSKIEK